MELAQVYQKHVKVYENGEIVFKQGDYGSYLYIVKSGAVNVTSRFANEEIALAIIDEGDFFGEMALFDYLPRSATVRARGRTELYVLSKEDLMESIKEFPEIAIQLLATMSKRLRNKNGEIEKLMVQGKITREMLNKCLIAHSLV